MLFQMQKSSKKIGVGNMALLGIGDFRKFKVGNKEVVGVVVGIDKYNHTYRVISDDGCCWDFVIGQTIIKPIKIDEKTYNLFREICKKYEKVYEINLSISCLNADLVAINNDITKLREKLRENKKEC